MDAKQLKEVIKKRSDVKELMDQIEKGIRSLSEKTCKHLQELIKSGEEARKEIAFRAERAKSKRGKYGK